MSDRPKYHVSTHAALRFIDRFDSGVKRMRNARRLLLAMASSGRELPIKGNQAGKKCILSRERVTGRRIFLIVGPNTEGDSWYVIKTVLTQSQACNTYGFQFPKEES